VASGTDRQTPLFIYKHLAPAEESNIRCMPIQVVVFGEMCKGELDEKLDGKLEGKYAMCLLPSMQR